MPAAITPEDITRCKPMLLDMLPKNGSTIGNKSVRRQLIERVKKELSLSLTDDDYWAIRDALIADGKVKPGRGNGGSVCLVNVAAVHPAPVASSKYRNEADLYPPVHKTLAVSWVKNYAIEDFVSQVTAQQGSRTTGGKWTRPDITLFAVRIYPFIPGKSVELITFEVKPLYAYGVDGVFETASHSAFAHRSYLLLYVPKDYDDQDVLGRLDKESERFGIGLITFEDPTDWDTFNIRVEAEHKTPDPSELCSFVNVQLTPDNRSKIQRMIR
jgi:hypothetical protein